MKSLQLTENLHWVGAQDPNLRVFDIIMMTEFGTSYNAYVLKGEKYNVIFETVKVKFFDDYMQKLREIMDPADIKYLVVSHTEPDHVGSIEKLLTLYPDITIVASQSAVKFLKEIVNFDFTYILADEKLRLDIGGKTLRFFNVPFLHWPDTIYTYVEEEKALITCDSFGAHYSHEEVLLSTVENNDDYLKALRYYYDMIFGPFKKYVLSALDKIKPLEIDRILTGHGPVLDTRLEEILNYYREWSLDTPALIENKIVIPYVSAYGYTETIANELERGILSEGEYIIEKHDMVYADPGEVINSIASAKGLLIGTPTINGDALKPMWDLLTSLSPIVHGGKIAAAFGSYGWSGEGVPNLTARLKQLRMKTFDPGLKVNFKPSENNLKEIFEFGKVFAQSVKTGKLPKKETTAKEEYEKIYDDGKTKLWKCVVCGEIFEGATPPDPCPACGAGIDQFVEVKEEKESFTSKEKIRLVIVGNQAAGTAAAEAARKRNKVAEITVIAKEKYPGYYRPLLTKKMKNALNDKAFYLKDEKWYTENKINLITGHEVIGIDKSRRTVTLNNFNELEYDKLILATGADSFIPPFEGSTLPGVLGLRNIDDVNRIEEKVETAKSAIVIGGGVLGLEAAWALKIKGLDVQIIELMDRIFPRQLDLDGSALLEEKIKDTGIALHLSEMVDKISKGNSLTVHTKSGKSFDTDFVVVSAGIRSNSALAEKIGLETNRGITVNEFMQTSDENIYAAGDCANYDNINFALWPEAMDQGKVAGANAIGDNLTYKSISPAVFFKGMNTGVYSVGELNDFENEYTFKEDTSYKKLFFKENKIVGGILINDVSKAVSLLKAIENSSPKEEVLVKVL